MVAEERWRAARGRWRVTGGPENFGCLIFNFGRGFPAKTRRRGDFGPGGAGPYRIFVNEKVNVKVGGNLVS